MARGKDAMAETANPAKTRVRVALRELDGAELDGKAMLVMGRSGMPEKLLVRGGLLPEGNTLFAASSSAEYLLTLESRGGELAVEQKLSRDGMAMVWEARVVSAMLVKGRQRAEENPDSWGDIIAEGELEELREALDGMLGGRASALTKEEVLCAKFRFTDGSEVEGRVLFGDGASVQAGCIRSEWERGKQKLVDALRVRGCHGVGCFLIKGNLQCVADISPAFTNVAGNPNAFTVEIGGHRYAGVIA